MTKLLLEIESEYWFDAECIQQALNEYFGKDWSFSVNEQKQQSVQRTADPCPVCGGMDGYHLDGVDCGQYRLR